MLACAAASMAPGVAMSTDTRTSGTTIMDVDAVKDTVGDGVPPGADAVVDAEGEFDGLARFEDDSEGYFELDGELDADAPTVT